MSAYKVQELLLEEQLSAGARISGWKIGLTSTAVQEQLGVAQPDFGVLLEHRGYLGGAVISCGGLLQPRIEAEIGFVLGSDLPDREVDEADVMNATDFVCAVLEIPDSRIQDWDIAITDTVADNASSGLYVVGSQRRPLKDCDVVATKMTLWRDDKVVSEGNGAACLGNPVMAVVWLANMLQSFGKTLRAGDLILSGALGPMVPVEDGARFRAELTGIGDVAVSFDSRP